MMTKNQLYQCVQFVQANQVDHIIHKLVKGLKWISLSFFTLVTKFVRYRQNLQIQCIDPITMIVRVDWSLMRISQFLQSECLSTKATRLSLLRSKEKQKRIWLNGKFKRLLAPKAFKAVCTQNIMIRALQRLSHHGCVPPSLQPLPLNLQTKISRTTTTYPWNNSNIHRRSPTYSPQTPSPQP